MQHLFTINGTKYACLFTAYRVSWICIQSHKCIFQITPGPNISIDLHVKKIQKNSVSTSLLRWAVDAWWTHKYILCPETHTTHYLHNDNFACVPLSAALDCRKSVGLLREMSSVSFPSAGSAWESCQWNMEWHSKKLNKHIWSPATDIKLWVSNSTRGI